MAKSQILGCLKSNTIISINNLSHECHMLDINSSKVFYEISIRGLSKNIISIICFLSKSFNFLFAFSFFQSFIALCNFNSSVIMIDF